MDMSEFDDHDFVTVPCLSCGVDYELACNKCGIRYDNPDTVTDNVCPNCYERLLDTAVGLLQAAKEVMRWSVASESDPTGDFVYFAEKIVPEIDSVLAYIRTGVDERVEEGDVY